MKRVFAAGCALALYKEHLATRIHNLLNEEFGNMERLQTCCRHDPKLTEVTEVINICPGCDKRYSNDYANTITISLWEKLCRSNSFPFPDYGGISMSIMDACPTRNKPEVHEAIRTLIRKMNINLVEPRNTGTRSTCCGDSFYGLIPVEDVKNQMRKRTSQMPVDNIIVYCVSCIKSVHIGGKKPRYLVDLLFNEETIPGVYEPDNWHSILDDYIQNH